MGCTSAAQSTLLLGPCTLAATRVHVLPKIVLLSKKTKFGPCQKWALGQPHPHAIFINP